MKMDEFTKDLPEVVECDKCGRKMPCTDWHVGPYELGEWMAMCVVQCAGCGCTKIPAVGSSEDAYRKARMMRLHLVVALDAAKRPRKERRNPYKSFIP